MNKIRTIHTSRTIMFAELEKVMGASVMDDSYLTSIVQNVTGKRSGSGVTKTGNYLNNLYGFDINDPAFKAFKHFWVQAETEERPILALVYAITRDDLLSQSISVLHGVQPGGKVSINLLEENIMQYHPGRFSPNTLRSMAQNIASSWKQAGFIEGKVKNIRVQPTIPHRVACFAFLLAWLNGERGDFIWNTQGVKGLCVGESKLRELAFECAKRDLMQYQYAGSITVIGFNNLLTKIGIDAI